MIRAAGQGRRALMGGRRLLSSGVGGLSHLKDHGGEPMPHMVDITEKAATVRRALARAEITFPEAVFSSVFGGGGEGDGSLLKEAVGPKGPVLATATVAAVQAAKKTSDLIPFCHPLALNKCDVTFTRAGASTIAIEVEAVTTGKTGVEMEALTAASVGALCVYDMCKALTHDMAIVGPTLLAKSGGKRDFDASGAGTAEAGA